MAIRQDKAVAIRPLWIDGVVAHIVIPQNLGNVSHTHWRSRVPGIRFLHSVHAQSADGVR